MSEARVVLMTAPDRLTAEALAERLLAERLAACVSLVPGIVSLFWWEGKQERAQEVLLLVKTWADRIPALTARAVELHPYDVPELLALPVAEGHAPYLEWMRRESRPGGAG